MKAQILSLLLLGTLSIGYSYQAQETNNDAISIRIQSTLDSLYSEETDFGGATLGVVFPDGSTKGYAIGYSDMESKSKMKPTDRMLGGSTGKVFVSAATMQLVEKNLIDLDDMVSKYLGKYDWYSRIQNAEVLNIRNLLRHSSGISRYVFNEQFLTDALASPDKVWMPEELLSYVFDIDPLFDPGTDFAYSDTNYIILAMMLEEVGGLSMYELIYQNIIEPNNLSSITPQVSREIAGLVSGYNAKEDKFYPGKVAENQLYKYNVQFEWAGGGYVMNAQALAKAGKLIYEGKIFSPELMDEFLDSVDAKRLGGKWGLGVHIMDTPKGKAYGHSGFFPGYVTNMMYFVDYEVAIAFQINTSDQSKLTLYGKMMTAMSIILNNFQRKN